MTQPTTHELNEKIAKIQVDIATIIATQQHQTRIFEEFREMAAMALSRADTADDKASEALRIAKTARDDLREYRDQVKGDRRWLIGIAVPVMLALVPVLFRYYF
ncbi:hypothetical protein NSS78_16005 [Bacillus sp. FSL W8-0920]|uniref:hypothetical protein n=1 Tax=Bacillus TaxID=1386 RepID=UPI0011A44D17|nr:MULTISPECIES: hypothetical protein [Bacillus]MED1527932.1 hypothetical protein [Bacillus pumilus]